jgi:hypothetical protein
MSQRIKARRATKRDLELEMWLRQRDQGLIVWITKEDDKIPINQMEDDHLLNTINLIDRAKERSEAVDSLLKDSVYLEMNGIK